MRELPQNQLDPRIKNVWRINDAVWLTLVFLCCFVPFLIAAATDPAPWITLVLVVEAVVFAAALVLWLAVLPPIRYVRWRYELSEDYLDIARGIIWRKRFIIPFIRVQNTDTRQGPILRAFGLSSVTVATAAGEHEIPGLAPGRGRAAARPRGRAGPPCPGGRVMTPEQQPNTPPQPPQGRPAPQPGMAQPPLPQQPNAPQPWPAQQPPAAQPWPPQQPPQAWGAPQQPPAGPQDRQGALERHHVHHSYIWLGSIQTAVMLLVVVLFSMGSAIVGAISEGDTITSSDGPVLVIVGLCVAGGLVLVVGLVALYQMGLVQASVLRAGSRGVQPVFGHLQQEARARALSAHPVGRSARVASAARVRRLHGEHRHGRRSVEQGRHRSLRAEVAGRSPAPRTVLAQAVPAVRPERRRPGRRCRRRGRGGRHGRARLCAAGGRHARRPDPGRLCRSRRLSCSPIARQRAGRSCRAVERRAGRVRRHARRHGQGHLRVRHVEQGARPDRHLQQHGVPAHRDRHHQRGGAGGRRGGAASVRLVRTGGRQRGGGRVAPVRRQPHRRRRGGVFGRGRRHVGPVGHRHVHLLRRFPCVPARQPHRGRTRAFAASFPGRRRRPRAVGSGEAELHPPPHGVLRAVARQDRRGGGKLQRAEQRPEHAVAWSSIPS